MEDDIVILEEDAPSVGVREIEAPLDFRRKVAAAAVPVVAPPPVPEPPKPVLHAGFEVYAHVNGALYWKREGGAPNLMAHNEYPYFNSHQTIHAKAASMWHGETPVFAVNEAALAVFKELLERYEVKVAAGFSLCFLLRPTESLGGIAQVPANNVVAINYSDGILFAWDRSKVVQLRERSPFTLSMARYFDEIKNMIECNTRAFRDDIKRWGNEKVATISNRSEELQEYIAELAPVADKKEIHDFLSELIEQKYVSDQGKLNSLTTRIKEMEGKVKDANGQLPAGRKGVVLKKTYMESAILGTLLEAIACQRDGNMMTMKFFFKKDLVVEGISYGRPILEAIFTSNREQGRDRSFVYSVKPYSADLKAFLHPHLRGEESWCLGTYSEPVGNAFMSGNLPMLVSLLWEYLSRYNSESPLVNLQDCRTQMQAARPRDLVVRRK